MRKLSFLFLFIFLCSLEVFSATTLTVLSATPKGELTESGRQAISITFNQPVVALGQSSVFSSQNCPLHITPAVKGTCRFVDSQTLLFEPAENWPVATHYTVKLNRGFSSQVTSNKLNTAYTFSFDTLRPRVKQVYPYENEHWVSLTPTLYAGFNMAMDAKKATSQAYLVDSQDNRIDVFVRSVTKEEYEKNFSYFPSEKYILAFVPTSKLQSGQEYTFVLAEGLSGESGVLGLKSFYKTTFVTTPLLSVLGTANEACLPFTPQIRFSSPVRLRDLMTATTVIPSSAKRSLTPEELEILGREEIIQPFAKLSPASQNRMQTLYNLSREEQQKGTAFFNTPLPFIHLQPRKSVQVKIDKNLTDIYGNRLGEDVVFSINNSGYCPSVDFSGGYGVLESYLPPQLPVELINTPTIDVQAARFNKENYIPFLQQDSSYCVAKPISATTFDGKYTFKDIKDKTLKTYLDLSHFSPTAQDSLIFSQLKLTRNGEDCWISSTNNLTDVGLTFKVSAENILLWATSLETGDPMPNLAVELRDSTNTILWSGSTDMHGLARAPGWNQLETTIPSWGTPKLYAFVSSAGGDGFISTELNNGLEPWRFNIFYTYNTTQESWRTFLFTERGIYRPGEEVHLTGIVRHWTDNTWKIPTEQTGKLVVSDSIGTKVFSDTVSLSANTGMFEVSFPISSNAHTGDWEAVFTPQIATEEVSSAYAFFKVDPAKVAEFEVALQADKTDYISGDTALFTASANYQTGAPLVNAPVKWTLQREMTWLDLKDYPNYIFTPYFLREEEYQKNSKLLADGTQQTDKKGSTSFSAKLPQVTTPVQIFAQASVQSPAKQDLFSRKTILLHPATFYLGAKLADGYAKAKHPVSAQVIAVTPQGKRVSASTVTAQIKRVEWHSVRKVGLSGRLEWVNSREEIELPSQTFNLPESGTTFSFVPPSSGTYYVSFTTTDEKGRLVKGGFDVMVFGKDGPAWAQNDDDLLSLTQDKNEYQVGETARISVQSPYDTAQALVSVEREGILDAWTTTIKGGADYIDIPIKENYLPNVFVSVTLVKGRTTAPVTQAGLDLGKPQGKTGYVNLNIVPTLKKITVDLSTRKKEYRPGDEVTVKLTTKIGRKAVPAQVILWVADEGVLALTDYKTPNPFNSFYEERLLSVFTADNRSYVIGRRNFGEKGENRGGSGSSYAKLGGIDLRSNFSFVPYFNAQIQTDKKGRAEIKFKLPDNLSRFRVMAVAVRENEFGAAQTMLTVSKPLMVVANLPKIVRVGDRFSCRAVAYNYADKKGELTLQAVSEGSVKLTDITSKTITVPLGQAQEISWPCHAEQTGPAKVSFMVKTNGESDGVRSEISVRPIEKPQTLTLQSSSQISQEQLLEKPSSFLETASNQVVISLASTLLLNLKGAITYLTTYPYDCLEQRLSKISPIVDSEQLLNDFKLGDISAYKKQAQSILTEIPDFQHPSGGFGYWKNSLPDPYVTAYALQTAFRAKQNGYTVPEQALKKATDWLEKAFNQNTLTAFAYDTTEIQTSRAQSVYVLSLYGRETSAAFNNLYAKRTLLPVPAVAYLLKAAQVSGREESIKNALAQQLLNHISYTPTMAFFSAHWPMSWIHQSDEATTALVLEALLEAHIPFSQAPQTVAWLLTQLNAQGHWTSTADNAAIVRALSRYEKAYESQTPNFTAEVQLNGENVFSSLFQGHTTETTTVSYPFSQIYAQQNPAHLKLSKTGTGTLYYTLSQIYTPKAYNTAVNAGFEVSRRITSLDGKEVTQLRAGERYYITLTVRTAASRHFVVVEDFIPAGVDIINTSLATEATDWSNKSSQNAFTSTERYDERMAAFADYLSAGTHEFTYLISAVTDGTFAYPSAWASLIYEPATFGRTASSTLIIEK